MEKTLAEIAREAWGDGTGLTTADDWKAVADAVVAAHEARRWREWPNGANDDAAEHPPDETPVLIYCGAWSSKDMLVGGISRQSGVFGPSGATHWTPIPAPPKEASDAE